MMSLVEFNQDLADSNEHKEGCDKIEEQITNNDKFPDIISGSNSFIFPSIKDCVYKDCDTHYQADKFKENLLSKIGPILEGSFDKQVGDHDAIKDDDNESLSNRIFKHCSKDETEYEISATQKEEEELWGDRIIFKIFPINLTSFMIFRELLKQTIWSVILSFKGLIGPQECCLMEKAQEHNDEQNHWYHKTEQREIPFKSEWSILNDRKHNKISIYSVKGCNQEVLGHDASFSWKGSYARFFYWRQITFYSLEEQPWGGCEN